MPDPESTGTPTGQPSVRDRWWFSPTLQIVGGAAVVAFQWGPISGGSANWANWLVALAGLLVVGYGSFGLLHAMRHRQPME
jgi:hypothetical protein